MKFPTFGAAAGLLATSLTFLAAPVAAQTPAPAAAQKPAAGPIVELAPEHSDDPPKKPVIAIGQGRVGDAELSRGLVERRFRSALDSLGHTSIGGYGELQVVGLASGKGASREWAADVRRMVLFVAHS